MDECVPLPERFVGGLSDAVVHLRLFAALFEHAHDGILVTDAGGAILAVNRAFCVLTGWEPSEVLGANPRLLQSGRHAPDFYVTMWQTLAERGCWHGEVWNRRRDGSAIAELLTITAVADAAGTVTHYVGVFSDITALKHHQQRHFDIDAQQRRAGQRRQALDEIAAALAADQLVLHYQPQIDARHGRVVGAEALLRWQHPQRGLLAPADFLPLVESEPALACAVGEWVLARAIAQLAAWARSGLALVVSVNVFADHLTQASFAPALSALLAMHPQAPPTLLQLEIVETVALDDVAGAGNVLDACRLLGVSFALDDFGTGYSSLTYFRRLPADVVKVDRSFVRDMLHDAADRAIVEAILALTRAFRRRAIAEGVESVEHGRHLLALGCELLQGYGIARPMPAAALPAWVAAFRSDSRWFNLATGGTRPVD